MSTARETPPRTADPQRDRSGEIALPPAVDAAIVGFRCPDEIHKILAAAKPEPSDENLEQINRGAK